MNINRLLSISNLTQIGVVFGFTIVLLFFSNCTRQEECMYILKNDKGIYLKGMTPYTGTCADKDHTEEYLEGVKLKETFYYLDPKVVPTEDSKQLFSNSSPKFKETLFDSTGAETTIWMYNGSKWQSTRTDFSKKQSYVVQWYENGNKVFEGNYKAELPDGKWSYWLEDGTPISTVNYVSGKLTDTVSANESMDIKYNEKAGRLASVTYMKDGIFNGPSWHWIFNGQLFAKGQYKDGLLEGEWVNLNPVDPKNFIKNPTGWHISEVNQTTNYKLGKKEGKSTYFQNGEKTIEQNYVDGLVHGKVISYSVGKVKGQLCKIVQIQNYERGVFVSEEPQQVTPISPN